MPRCRHCSAETDDAHYERVVHNRCSLHGPWTGWRMAGRDLVSPHGDRFSPERLEGLAWRMQAEARRDAARARNETRRAGQHGMVTVLRVRQCDWHAERFGNRAG
ncbi:phage protein [Luteimonas sp. Y-2-2-4F]|nr:phage protein [Luteimonas sp. Y-2-2-4F]